MAGQVVFTIDGGGIRGILPLLLLKELQANLETDLVEFNTSWWGTSTGALICSALSVQQNTNGEDRIQNVLDMYEFRAAAAVNPQGAALPARALNQLIDANFKDIELSDFPNLNIIASEADTLNPVLFNAANNCLLTDAVKASCAFPGVFPAVNIENKLYVDGFYKAKNPAEIAFNNQSREEKPLVIISLGTGVLRATDPVEDQVRETHERLTELAKLGSFNYFRLNPTLNAAVDSMQNTSAKNIMNLRKDGVKFIKENTALFAEIISVLKQL